LVWLELISSASSGRRAHRTTGALSAASEATVEPHDPAPITATHARRLIGEL
jgi:hypothetical protein